MRSSILAITSALVLTAAVAPDAMAQKKKTAAAACGLSFLPMVEGRVWTYQFSAGDSPASTAEAKPVLKVEIPQKFTVKVVKIETKGGSAEVTLEETYRKLTQTTRISCSREGVNVDPNSFFASGEPGGGIGMTIENFKRSADSYTFPRKGAGLMSGESREDLTFDVTRPPSQGTDVAHALAKVEVERLVRVSGTEETSSGLGDHPKATKVEIQLTGRAYVVDKEKSVNMTPGVATLFFAPDVGLVRAINGFGHAWILSSIQTGNEPVQGGAVAPAPAPTGAAAPAAPAAAPATPTPPATPPPAASEPQVAPLKQ